MKLKELTVEGYKSFKKRQNLIVDEKITIFIGANDHGKTNLLEAIKCLNDDSIITQDDKNYDLPNGSDCRITWHFSLTDNEVEKLNNFQVFPLGNEDNNELESVTNITPKTEETSVNENDTELEPNINSPSTTEEFPADEIDKELITKIKNSSTTGDIPINVNGELVFSRNFNEKVKVESVPISNIPISSESLILGLRPKVELFKLQGNNIVDSINRQELNQNECIQGIFRLAGLWNKKDEIFTISTTTTRILDQASETLTNALRDQWNQGKDLEWKIKHVGNNGERIEINIKDPAISNTYSKPSLRSAGFQTYFLLSMIISARTASSDKESFIFLFDEPATELHPKAQLDLQRSFEVIAENAQIAYTTHSLFLINKNYPKRNCVINKTGEGSLIDHKPFINNWKSLRESLGILMSNNFLIADKTILVEGPSDIFYILIAIKKLKLDSIIDIDLNDFCIVDAGSRENYVSMAKLMLSEGREIVALVDGNGHGNLVEKELGHICRKEIDDKRLIIHKLPENTSIEDVMVDHEIFREAIMNQVKSLDEQKILNKKAGIEFSAEIKKIIPNKKKTLGKIFEEVTESLWEPNTKISKLNLAMIYEVYN